MHRIALSISALILGLAAAAPAAAERALVVRHGDLDLASAAGVAALDRRLASTIDAHCREIAPYLPHQAQARRDCREQAWRSVEPQRAAAIAAARNSGTRIGAR